MIVYSMHMYILYTIIIMIVYNMYICILYTIIIMIIHIYIYI